MTETTPATTSAPAPAEPTVLGFGIAEIAYLLSLGTGPQADKSRRLLTVGPDMTAPVMLAAGASSLLARGLVRVDGDAVIPNAGAEYVAFAFAASYRWTEVGLQNERKPEFALYFQAPEVSLLLQPAALGSWFAVIKDPAATDAEMLRQVIEQGTSALEPAAVLFGSSTLSDETNYFVRRNGGGGWDVAHVTPAGEQQRRPAVSESALLADLQALTQAPA
ncbi:hypothetical protein [Arthrobacter sp. NPDC092385]|uniref:hypothetical protein n=1 Tax=Arthrobacter sp. NPDC092385 TaxID=3363943 RepID=UPI003827C4F2